MKPTDETGLIASAIVLFVSLFFWRGAIDTFDLVKASILWFGAGLLCVSVARRWSQRRPIDKFFLISIVGFGLAAVLSTIFSLSPRISIFGQSQRYNGLLTLLSCCALGVAIARFFDARSRDLLVAALAAVLVGGTGYTWIQRLGLDPFEWSIVSFGEPVFGTLGNPNTTSALIAVLAPFALHRALYSSSVARRMPWGGICGASLSALAILNSFQGSIAILPSVWVLWSWFKISNRNLLDFTVVGGWVVALFAFPNFSSESGGGLLMLAASVGVVLSGFTGVRVAWLDRTSSALIKAAAGLAVLMALLVAPRMWKVVQAGLEDGFSERGAFYRSALGTWLDFPVTGSGIDTFGFVFTSHRPLGHAVNLEASRTSSVHSVHLGMFSNGGLLLGLSYLLLIAAVFRQIYVQSRRLSGKEKSLLVTTGSAFAASQIQSSVSVEHVGLFTLQFALIGLLFTFGTTGVRSRSARRSKAPISAVTSLIAVLLVALVSWSQLARPLRANVEAKSGLESAYRDGNADLALRKLSRAVELAPWDPNYLLFRIELLQQSGLEEYTFDDAKRAIELFRHNSGVTIPLASILASQGDYGGAVDAVELAIQGDPYAPSLKQEAAALYVNIADFLVTRSEIAEAEDFYRRALIHVQNFQPALVGLSSLGVS